jgi:hypothetical protein
MSYVVIVIYGKKQNIQDIVKNVAMNWQNHICDYGVERKTSL